MKKKLVEMTLSLYEDACGREAESAFGNSPESKKNALMAWSRYDGAKVMLTTVFPFMTERMVDSEMELLMTEKLFS